MALFPAGVNKLLQDLGHGMPISAILSGVAFVTYLFFYLYVLGSFFKITVYPLMNRVTSETVFKEHVINEYLDNVVVIAAATSWFLLSIKNRTIRYSLSIAYGASGIILAAFSPDNVIFDIFTLLSFALIISVALYHYKQQKKFLNFNAKLTLRYISVAVIAISAIGIVFLTLSVFLAPLLEVSRGNIYSNELFLLLSSFSAIYIFLLIFCLPVKFLFKEVLRMLKLDLREDISQATSNNHE